MERQKYRQFGEEAWRRHIEVQERTGQGILKYCEKNGLGVTSFHRWRKLLSQRSEGVGFMRLETQASQPARVELIITTPNGCRVETSSAEAGISV
jgi:hypothetical protein